MTTASASPAAKAELAPTGKLRAGINFQNQLLTTLGPNGEQGGVAVEFARELAKRLAVPLEIISYKSAGSLADAVSSGDWDISVLGDEPQRAAVIAFAPPLTEIYATYLVPSGSAIRSIAEVDRPGIRIVSPAKSAYDLYLSRTIKNAQLVQIAGTGTRRSTSSTRSSRRWRDCGPDCWSLRPRCQARASSTATSRRCATLSARRKAVMLRRPICARWSKTSKHPGLLHSGSKRAASRGCRSRRRRRNSAARRSGRQFTGIAAALISFALSAISDLM